MSGPADRIYCRHFVTTDIELLDEIAKQAASLTKLWRQVIARLDGHEIGAAAFSKRKRLLKNVLPFEASRKRVTREMVQQ